MTPPTDHAPPVQDFSTATCTDLLVLAGPNAAVILDAHGRVERLAHRDFPDIDLDQPRPR